MCALKIEGSACYICRILLHEQKKTIMYDVFLQYFFIFLYMYKL